MKRRSGFIIAGLLLLGGFQSQALLKCDNGDTETLTLANALYDETEKLFKRNLIERNQLIRAHIFLYEAKLCAHAISTREFCDVALPSIKRLNGLTLEERRERISLLAEAKAVCEKPE